MMKLSIAFVRPVMFLLFTWFLDAHAALPCLQTIKLLHKSDEQYFQLLQETTTEKIEVLIGIGNFNF